VSGHTLLSQHFGWQELAGIRHLVTAIAAQAGLAGYRLHEFVVAVNEIVTNAIRHGGGFGHIRIWCADDQLRVEVTDHGPGMRTEHLAGGQVPSATDLGGRGLWLVRQLCDSFSIRTGPTGTTVQAAAQLTPNRR
jgi:serine/threonine-protein kinase RsbW